MISTIIIQTKIGWEDPSTELIYNLMETINQFLPKQNQLFQPEINGKYILFSLTNTIIGSPPPPIDYVSGLVAGFLLANGVEVI